MLTTAAKRHAIPQPPNPAFNTQMRSNNVANNKQISPIAKKMNPGKYATKLVFGVTLTRIKLNDE